MPAKTEQLDRDGEHDAIAQHLDKAATKTPATASGDMRHARDGRRRGALGVSGCGTRVRAIGSIAAQHIIVSKL